MKRGVPAGRYLLSVLVLSLCFLAPAGCETRSTQGRRVVLGDDFELVQPRNHGPSYLRRCGDSIDVDGLLDAPADSIGWDPERIWARRSLPLGRADGGWMIVDRTEGLILGPFDRTELLRRVAPNRTRSRIPFKGVDLVLSESNEAGTPTR